MNQENIKKALEYFNSIAEPTEEQVTAKNTLQFMYDIGCNLDPQRVAMMRALGWCFANFCLMLEDGVDPRFIPMDRLIDQFEKDFGFEKEAIVIVQSRLQ